MNKLKLLLIPVLLLTLNILPPERPVSPLQNSKNIEAKKLDQRARILADYFASYNSPLQYQAQDFIEAADTYGVDWKLVPAISGVESTFGRKAYGYNAWGWGIYGNQALGFKSWKDGIYTVTGGLRKNYLDKGLKDPYAINKIYAASPSWGWKVSYFMQDLENFIQKKQPRATGTNQLVKTAAPSATLAYQN
ncbi:glucosaminidase domain-containing protein [Candidatus Daviesbacteria bacterium]|nr:glucosaminidase domain-containing protein [Candidatus Daviesbacteria bacterium]